MKVQERTMSIDGGGVTWLEAGAGWPLILLHGFPLNAGMWRPQLEAVPEGWRFIAPDLRGFGGRRGAGPVSMDGYAADVLGLMDGLELDDAVIGGLSMGGYVTFAMFRQAPSRFTGMILADTRSQADTPQVREGRLSLRALLARDGPRGVADQLLPKLLGEAARGPAAPAARETRAMIEAAAPEAIDAAIGALIGRPDSTPVLSSIACSTLVLVGAQDEITPPAEAELMQRAMPRSTLCVIPDAGHLSNLEQPATFSRALSDFLLARL
jgi:pimeloyl-ACP methyl ester carboxylesterase